MNKQYKVDEEGNVKVINEKKEIINFKNNCKILLTFHV